MPTKKIVLCGLMTAIVFLLTYFLHIRSPISQGYFNIGDAAIMITAMLLGRNIGFFAGAVGSAAADMALGSFIFAPATFIIKGVEGYLTGLIAYSDKGKHRSNAVRIIAVIIGALTMAAGYFAAEATILRLFDKTLGYTAAVIELPGNLTQGFISAIIGYTLSTLLIKTNTIKLDR